MDLLYEWSQKKMVEVVFDKPDDFLKIKETLSRIGILGKRADNNGKQTLYQSCHLLHKRGKYYILHFKELFCLDGKESDLSLDDIERRNLIISLLKEWGLIRVINPNLINIKAPMSAIRIIAYTDKNNFNLKSKYQIGRKNSKENDILDPELGSK